MADVEAKIEREYKAGAGPKALSEKYGVSVDTIKSWIKRRKWKRGAPSDEGAPLNVAGVHPDERGNTPQKGRPKSAPAPPMVLEQSEEDEPENGSLTPKQRRFVQEYLIDLNATQAAIRAGYSVKSADKIGSELLGKTRVAEAVDKAMAERESRTGITQDWVLRKLKAWADYDSRDFQQIFTETVQFKTKSGDVIEMQVQNVRFNEDFDGTVARAVSKGKDGMKMDMPDSIRAMELIMRHLGMLDSPHKRRLDNQRFGLDQERFEHQKRMDELRADLAAYKALPKDEGEGEPTESDGFDDAGGSVTAKEAWEDHDTSSES